MQCIARCNRTLRLPRSSGTWAPAPSVIVTLDSGSHINARGQRPRGEHREPLSAASCGSPSGATLPPPRVSLGVHAGDDNDRVTVDAVEETIREALGDEHAPGVTMQ